MSINYIMCRAVPEYWRAIRADVDGLKLATSFFFIPKHGIATRPPKPIQYSSHPICLDVEVDPIRLEKELGVRCIFCPREGWLEHVEAVASKDAVSLATEFKRRFKLINIKDHYCPVESR